MVEKEEEEVSREIFLFVFLPPPTGSKPLLPFLLPFCCEHRCLLILDAFLHDIFSLP